MDHRAGDEGLRQRLGDDAAAQLFHHHHGLHGPHAHAAVVFVHVDAGQAELGQFVVDAAVEAAGLDGGLTTLEVVAFLDPFGDGVAQGLLVV